MQHCAGFLLVSLVWPALAFGQQPPATVSTIVAHASTWQDHFDAVGSIRAVRGADLAAEVAGIVDSVSLQSGQDIAAGTVLMRLRANDDDAKLADLAAQADLAASNLARDTKQFRAQAVSQASIDADTARLRSARAEVAQQQALMAEKIVRAPFAGRLGLRMVDQGQYLAAGTTVFTLQALDPLYIDFYVPQQTLPQLQQGEAVSLSLDAFPGRVFSASLEAINPKLDTASRMAMVRALVRNPDHALMPGMFASVALNLGKPRTYITLPNSAIVYNPYGSLVYVVSAKGSAGAPAPVRQVLVTTGPTRGDQIAVIDGVHEGDVVVTAGQIKLRQGSMVVVNNTVLPANDPHPHPAEE